MMASSSSSETESEKDDCNASFDLGQGLLYHLDSKLKVGFRNLYVIDNSIGKSNF